MVDVGFGVYVNGHTNYSMEWSSDLFEYSYVECYNIILRPLLEDFVFTTLK